MEFYGVAGEIIKIQEQIFSKFTCQTMNVHNCNLISLSFPNLDMKQILLKQATRIFFIFSLVVGQLKDLKARRKVVMLVKNYQI